MSRFSSNYDELVDKFKNELLSDEKLLDQFEERFERRLVEKSAEELKVRDSR